MIRWHAAISLVLFLFRSIPLHTFQSSLTTSHDTHVADTSFPYHPAYVHTLFSAVLLQLIDAVQPSTMNSLNALGNRQIASLNADLSKMESGESGPSIQGRSRYLALLMHIHLIVLSVTVQAHTRNAGQITTTLGALSRLIDDYDSMARKEMVTAAREKAVT